MKLLCPVLIALAFSISITKAEIRNGYLDIGNARMSLKNLKSTLASSNELTAQQSRKVKETIRLLTEHILYFQLTENLISHFRVIAPDLYDEVNALHDKDGKATDVFIKFIPKEQTNVQHPGITYIKYNDGDNTCFSEYGAGSVSIKIWIMDTSLSILAHELGHTAYEVPNLASYDEYYDTNYRSQTTKSNYIGHNPSDPSGNSANTFQKRFIDDYRNYVKGSLTKIPSPRRIRDGLFRTKAELERAAG